MSIRQSIEDSIALKNLILKDQILIETIDKASQAIISAFRNGNKVMFCGNGGSAADAQHLAAELSGRFYYDRDPLPAEALHVNTSYLTAVANDYGYDEVFSRMVKGSGKKGDVLVGLSTSGNSKNVIKAFETANALGITTIGMTGSGGGKMKDISGYLINVPSENTARIQEAHIMIGHILCEIVESNIYPR